MAMTVKEQLLTVDALKAELDLMRPLKPEQEQRAFEKLRLEWNYHSNAIEGNQLTPGETRLLLMEGITADGKPLKDYLDIEGHNHVIDWLVDFVRAKQELSEVHIRGMHEILLVRPYEVTAFTQDGKPVKKVVQLGSYKTQPNQVTTPTGAIKRFASPEETSPKMGELMQWLRREIQKRELHPVMISAILHHEFVSIHPFDDGNGRMARLLMNLILMHFGFPPAIIQLQERDSYFLNLARADAGDREPLIVFIAEKVARSLQLYLRAAKGESVEDHDDIDKQIALLKRELDHLPDPIVYDRKVYLAFMEKNGTRLFEKIFRKLSTFDELYVERRTNVFVHNHGVDISNGLAQVLAELTGPRLDAMLGTKGSPDEVRLHFSWQHFKKGGLIQFNDAIHIAISFERLKYRITWPGQKPPPIERLYADNLTDEECVTIANVLAKHCLETIQKNRTKAQPS